MKDRNKLFSVFKHSDIPCEDGQRDELIEIWRQASRIDPARFISVSQEEIDEAFSKVSSEIQSASDTVSSSHRQFITYAAAAVFVLFTLLGLAYVFIPVTVSTPKGTTKMVQLPDQSTVYLNSDSQISYSRMFNMWGREVSLDGEAFFEVRSAEHPFRVITPNAAIKVTGTKFNVRCRPDEAHARTSVFLLEGVVSFQSRLAESQPLMLKAGQKSWISNIEPTPAPAQPVDPEWAIAWQKNNIAFDNQPISIVFAELERRFNVTIHAHPKILTKKITIYLSEVEQAESAIRDICLAKGLTYKKENDKFLVYYN